MTVKQHKSRPQLDSTHTHTHILAGTCHSLASLPHILAAAQNVWHLQAVFMCGRRLLCFGFCFALAFALLLFVLVLGSCFVAAATWQHFLLLDWPVERGERAALDAQKSVSIIKRQHIKLKAYFFPYTTKLDTIVLGPSTKHCQRIYC